MRFKVTTVSSPLLVRNNPSPSAGVVANLPSGSIIEVPADSVVRNGFRLIKRQGNWSHWAAERYLQAYHGPLAASNLADRRYSTSGTGRLLAESTDPSTPGNLPAIASRILKDPVLARINFRYSSLTVSGVGLLQVARAIDQGEVEVVEQDLTNARMAYDFVDDVILISPGVDLNQLVHRGSLVHEATHALQDYQQRRSMLMSDAEGSAFLAQYYYYLLKAPELIHRHDTEDLAGVALSIARRIHTTNDGNLVQPSEIARMRRMLAVTGYSNSELNRVRTTNGFRRR